MRSLLLTAVLLTRSFASAGGASPALPGQVFERTATGTLYTGKAGNGIDFKVWFTPAGHAPRLLLDPQRTFPRPQTSLAMGATLGQGQTVYILVQHAYNHNDSDQIIYSVNRLTHVPVKVIAMSELKLHLALGEVFRYDAARDRLIFSAIRPERDASGQVGSVQHLYSYGPLQRSVRTLLRQP